MHSSQKPHQAQTSVAGPQKEMLEVQKGDLSTISLRKKRRKIKQTWPTGRPLQWVEVSGFISSGITKEVILSLQVLSAACRY
jgi:hypothetical protein